MTVLGQAVPVVHGDSVYPDSPSLCRSMEARPHHLALGHSVAPLPVHRGAPSCQECLWQGQELWQGLALLGCAVTTSCSLPAFRALLQIRAVRKKPGALSPVSFSPVLAQSVDHDEHSVSTADPCAKPGPCSQSQQAAGGCRSCLD